MKSSPGRAAVSAFSTVSPPMPESNTPMGRSIAAREPRRFPFDAAIEFERALDFFRVGILGSTAREALADCSWSHRRRAKDRFMDAGRFHAQIGGDLRTRLSETSGKRAVKTQPQRSESAKAAVGGEHILAAQHRIAGKTAASGAAQIRRHPKTAHTDKRDLFGRHSFEQLVDQLHVV